MTDEKELRETAKKIVDDYFGPISSGTVPTNIPYIRVLVSIIKFALHRDRAEREKCIECNGTGTKTYGDTACGRGIGGQMITGAACDKCLGTGRIPHIAAKLERLRTNMNVLDRQWSGWAWSKNIGLIANMSDQSLDEAIDAALREVEK